MPIWTNFIPGGMGGGVFFRLRAKVDVDMVLVIVEESNRVGIVENNLTMLKKYSR